MTRLPGGVSITNSVNGRGVRYYKVRLGKKFTGGLPVVRNFRELTQAQNWIFGTRTGNRNDSSVGITELKRIGGAAAFAFTFRQLAEAAWAFSQLGAASLIDAVKFYVSRPGANGTGKRLSELIDEHIAALAEEGCGSTYVRNQEITCKVLARKLADPMLTAITCDMIAEVIREMNWKPLNRRNYMRDWAMCFRRAIRLGYLSQNPLDSLKRPKIERTEPQIYTVDEARMLLQLTRTEFPDLLPFVSLGLFAGVRVQEMRRMNWSMIDMQHGFVVLKANITKGGEPRDIEIMPNLQKWLRVCGNRGGPIVPQIGFRQRLDALYRAVGFRRRNALRHSFASYFLALTGSPERTQLVLGQQTPSVLFRYYRQFVRLHVAKSYWKIIP